MIQDKDLPELKTYRALEKKLPLQNAPQFASLVVPTEAETVPIHRWFRYKEAFSPDLLEQALLATKVPIASPLHVADPFSGVGTTLLSGQLRPDKVATAIGLERNPFSAFVARTKLCWPEIDSAEMNRLAAQVIGNSAKSRGPLPGLSSIRTGRCISPFIAGRIVAIRDALLKRKQSPARDALLLGLAAAVEPLSRVRKDGRALRIVDRPVQQVAPTLRRIWSQMAADVDVMRRNFRKVAITKITEGDGRRLSSHISPETLDLVFTSPPYPNNIDYSEVYKLELWLLGFIKDQEAFLSLRKSTLRSHPTSDLGAACDEAFIKGLEFKPLSSFFDPMIERASGLDEKWRKKLLMGYFSDLWASLDDQFRCLKAGGRSFMVVANSLHGCSGSAYLVPTDILLGQIGVCIGFQLEKILVARSTKRRLSGNHFLRESIVVLRKPHA